MKAPDDFARELYNTFNGRFRLRWSDKRQEWHLEQKVFTGQVMEPPPIDPDAPDHFDTYDDHWIRARDGYFYIMTIRTGDRMPCPVCGLTVKVPVLETRESFCAYCQSKGRDGRYVAAYYPLNHILIQHLRDIDPLTDGPKRARQRVQASWQARWDRDKKAEIDAADYAVINDKTQVEDNPMVGYGPKTAQRHDAPLDRLRD